ncbi:MAG: AAA family ATPase, partial [Actinobacteria bacterium]|nr:AAA family ATPase [Actinomycetota bacterium]
VLLVDEAGMAETRVLGPMLELVERAEGKAILVGDPAQLPAVGAGGLYPALCERLGAIGLADNRRQRDLSEREVLARLRTGDPSPYLAYAARAGRLQLADDATVAKQRVLEDWWRVAQHDLRGTVILAYRRADVRDLNEAARTLMMRAGRLGPEAVEFGEREFRVGDRVLCRRNNPRFGVRSGTRGTVVDLDETAITLRTDTGETRLVPLAYVADHLEHGYALTGHAAQGTTVERAFVLLRDEGALREWGYVACTRARGETRLYFISDAHEREAHGRELEPTDASERLARALTASSSERLAIDRTSVTPTSDASLPALADRRRHLERARLRTEQGLADAEAKLKQIGWRARHRHGAELRMEIEMRRATLRIATQQLAEISPVALPATPRRADQALDRTPPRERALMNRRAPRREPPGLSLDR